MYVCTTVIWKNTYHSVICNINTWKQMKFPSSVQMGELIVFWAMERYTVMKMKALSLQVPTQLCLAQILLNKGSQTKENIQCMIPFIWSLAPGRTNIWSLKSWKELPSARKHWVVVEMGNQEVSGVVTHVYSLRDVSLNYTLKICILLDIYTTFHKSIFKNRSLCLMYEV